MPDLVAVFIRTDFGGFFPGCGPLLYFEAARRNPSQQQSDAIFYLSVSAILLYDSRPFVQVSTFKPSYLFKRHGFLQLRGLVARRPNLSAS